MREMASIYWHRATTLAAFLLAWALLAIWQWQEYQAESEAVRDGVRRQAESVMNALVGGVQSHRRLGRFLEPQIQGMLDELAKSQDVLAAAVVSADKRFSLSAGKTDLLKLSEPIEPGHSWEEEGFRYAVAFQVAPDIFGFGPGMPPVPGGPRDGGQERPQAGQERPQPPEPPARQQETRPPERQPGPWPGEWPGGLQRERPHEAQGEPRSSERKDNLPEKHNVREDAQPEHAGKQRAEVKRGENVRDGNYGAGRGTGFGRGGPWTRGSAGPMAMTTEMRQFSNVGRFFAVLILERQSADQQVRHYAWLRLFTVGAGGIVIVSVALAWQATVRLAAARGHAQLLENETRHLRELSQAAAGLAHETRNPLGLIRGWAQRWMQSVADNPQQRQQVQAVIEECDRVTVRINQFLAFARPCQPKVSDVLPAEIFDELAVLLQPDLEAKRLSLVKLLPEDNRCLVADREMLRQALFNLLQNAIAFSPEGGVIEIILKAADDGTARIEILDRGPGVSPQAIDLLFMPYHTTRAGGTGLGLATVRRIATAHGWQSGYTARPGGGAIFWLNGIRFRPVL